MVVEVAAFLALVLAAGPAATDVNVTVDTGADVREISPLIYGSNAQGGDAEANVAAVRSGGNRMTGYNWETNYSSAGNDWQHSNDDFLVGRLPADQWRVPGIAVTRFHEYAASLGAADVVTLQMAGYVAADNRGPVPPEQTAPSPRWVKVEFAKGAPFLLQPDTTDGVVYMDEFVNFMVTKYGRAAGGGVKMYSLDNEPCLWSNTHPRIHPRPVTCDELIERSVALSLAVKRVDPTAQVIGPALFGWSAFQGLQGQPEQTGWSKYSGQYEGWFINFYLDKMREAEARHGQRLLDVLDVHWYPEARGDGVRITGGRRGGASEGLTRARVQAPRSLWDGTYREDSWIAQWNHPIRLLPRLEENIEKYYPGTRLSITEFDYGGSMDVSGAVAQADVLGLFGKYGVYMANHWGSLSGYVLAAYQAYRNYDGHKSTFGDKSVRATTSDAENTSAYAALDAVGRVHVVLINKDLAAPTTFNLTVTHGSPLTSAEAYAVDSSGPQVRPLAPMRGIEGNRLTFTAGPLSVNHLILSGQ
jgi:mannan endo-1,4-beta-mannosidase